MSRYVRPRRRSSSINSRYGSRRDRGDFAGSPSRMSFKLSSIRAAKPRQNLLRVYSGRALVRAGMKRHHAGRFWCRQERRLQCDGTLRSRIARRPASPPRGVQERASCLQFGTLQHRPVEREVWTVAAPHRKESSNWPACACAPAMRRGLCWRCR
jgi:hypothetical protein